MARQPSQIDAVLARENEALRAENEALRTQLRALQTPLRSLRRGAASPAPAAPSPHAGGLATAHDTDLLASYRLLARYIPDGAVALFDHELRHIIASGGLIAQLGFSISGLEGRTPHEIGLSPQAAEMLAQNYHAALNGSTISFEVPFADRLLALLLSPVFDDDGQVIAGVLVARDITSHRQREREQLQIERKLQEALFLENLSVLAEGIAHDFNNILTSIIGYAELTMLDLPAHEPARASVDAIVGGARRASDLTRQLLAYAGKGRFAVQALELSALVSDQATLLHGLLGPGATLALSLAEPLPPVAVDASQIEQLLIQLVKNAAEALDHSLGTITISTRLAALSREKLDGLIFGAGLLPGQYVGLTIADNGPGMDEATLARAFTPFFSTKFTGRGLGLAAVHGIVRSHDAALQAESAPGRGATFRIWFPVAAPAARIGLSA